MAPNRILTQKIQWVRMLRERLLQMHFAANDKYQKTAAPAVERRLVQAGIRLAVILNEAVNTALTAR